MEAKENEIPIVVLDLPTGAGKSFIAMGVSALLNDEGESGYILASDLGLLGQYSEDFEKFSPDFRAIRGVDNYSCDINGLKFSLGDCKSRNYSYQQMSELSCYNTCGYHSARNQAIESMTTLMTYQYWLLQRNYVGKKLFGKEKFGQRDFVIFDECHRIPDIVQNHFSPIISEKIFQEAKKVQEFASRFKFKHIPEKMRYKPSVDWLKLTDGIGKLMDERGGITLPMEMVFSETRKLEAFGKALKSEVGMAYPSEAKLPPEILAVASSLDFLKDVNCKMEDSMEIQELVPRSGIKDCRENSANIYITAENFLVYRTLTSKAGFKVFMSATTGGFQRFMRSIGASKVQATYITMPSNFKFNNSEIYYGTGIRMKHGQSFEPLVKILDAVMERHGNQRGIVHTASYSQAEEILRYSKHKDRFLVYRGTSEKEIALRDHMENTNSVLLGPSMIEGVNLTDDLARFQVVAKCPYPSLGNKLVNAKFQKDKGWYRGVTSVAVQQSLGRAIRHPEDEAKSYILDDAVLDVIGDWPPHLTKRMRKFGKPQ